ncbi:MAG: MBOAT family O-acyltransferase [Cyanobacteria bacterium P01_A01_bin.135]
MTLLSITYGIFLLSVLGLYWLQEARSLRLGILLLASLVFYASLQIQYLPLLLVMALIAFGFGRQIAAAPLPMEHFQPADAAAGKGTSKATRKPVADGVSSNGKAGTGPSAVRAMPQLNRRLVLLWLGIGLQVAVLVGFKYLGFLFTTAGSIIGLPLFTIGAERVASIIAPLGISYFVFECIAYLVDTYRGAPAARNLLQFLAYKLFFPKLLSGPITRYHTVEGQLAHRLPLRLEQSVDGLWLIAVGALKKLLLADHLATLVNLSFGNLERAGSGDIWLAVLAYGLQLYFDFSGYVDVARGSGILLGVYLPENFRGPYFSTSIADFWRRWHITLGNWLRNYLYFPLGGSRQGLLRTCFNLIIVMVVAGIWHNPGWGFVIWGLIHGVALAAHRLTEYFSQRSPAAADFWARPPGVLLGWGLTQVTVFFSWIFFRLPEPSAYGLALNRLVGQSADIQFAAKIYQEGLQVSRPQAIAMVVAVIVGMAVVQAFKQGLKVQFNWYLKIALVPLLIYLAWLLAPSESLPYIYFDF